MRYRVSFFLILVLLIGATLEAHGQHRYSTMQEWMAHTPNDQLMHVAGAVAATSVFVTCENQQLSVGVVTEALRAGYRSGVFKPDDKLGDAFFRSLKPYNCVAFTDFIPLPTEKPGTRK